MSAAEPSHPTGEPGRAVPGTVLSFPTAHRPRRSPRSERTSVPPDLNPDLSHHQRLAASLEALFAGSGLSLTGEETAEAFRITVGAVRGLLEGARVQGILDAEAFGELDGMLEGMLTAPGLLG